MQSSGVVTERWTFLREATPGVHASASHLTRSISASIDCSTFPYAPRANPSELLKFSTSCTIMMTFQIWLPASRHYRSHSTRNHVQPLGKKSWSRSRGTFEEPGPATTCTFSCKPGTHSQENGTPEECCVVRGNTPAPGGSVYKINWCVRETRMWFSRMCGFGRWNSSRFLQIAGFNERMYMFRVWIILWHYWLYCTLSG